MPAGDFARELEKEMKGRALIEGLLGRMGGRFSASLGIDLDQGDSQEVFKWFLASILYGARISETIASNTYHEFERSGVLSPDSILETGWHGLVEILDTGGYVRYDFKTATKLLEVMKALKERFKGDLNVLHAQAEGPRDLEARLMGLGKGIGPTTANIFLRELRDVWGKAEPLPQDLAAMVVRKAVDMARQLNIAVLGVVENMSYFECPDSGKRYEIFGPSHADEVATAASAMVLARLPVDPELSRLGDSGQIAAYNGKLIDELGRAFEGECPLPRHDL